MPTNGSCGSGHRTGDRRLERHEGAPMVADQRSSNHQDTLVTVRSASRRAYTFGWESRSRISVSSAISSAGGSGSSSSPRARRSASLFSGITTQK